MSSVHASANRRYIGRTQEVAQIRACLKAGRNVLLEGPVGVGKTHLVLGITQEWGQPVFRVDGDNRYSEQKLSGWFDPASSLKKGFCAETFVAGPLVEAMQKGGILFINELNRLPEGVQNVLLPAIDERMIIVPRLGEIRAASAFLVVATQNPKEFVATSHLSEAILDRFELVVLDYQAEIEEVAIVRERLVSHGSLMGEALQLPVAAVRLVRLTRNHASIKRGASVRAALSVAEIALVMMKEGEAFKNAFLTAALLALPTRIEMERNADSEGSSRAAMVALLTEWVNAVLQTDLNGPSSISLKKKSSLE